MNITVTAIAVDMGPMIAKLSPVNHLRMEHM